MAWTPDFDWICPDLAVGGRFPPERLAALPREHGVGAVIDLRAEDHDDPAAMTICRLRFLHLPTMDRSGVSQEMLDEAVAFTREAARDRLKVLIHCEHGIGRSAIAALCVLADRGAPPLEALTRLKDAREVVSPSAAQYEAWRLWLSRRVGCAAPTYHEFGVIAYRHLAGPA